MRSLILAGAYLLCMALLPHDTTLDLLGRLIHGPSQADAEHQLEMLASRDPESLKVLSIRVPVLLASPEDLQSLWLLAELAGNLKIASAINPLCELLTKSNKSLSTDFYRASELKDDPVGAALAKIGAPAVEPVAILLSAKEPGTRSRAVRVLAKIGTPESLIVLRQARGKEQDRQVAALMDGVLLR